MSRCYYYSDITDMIETLELKLLPFEKPHFVMLTFSSISILKKVLINSNFPNGLYIDDDKGNVFSIDEYIQILKRKS